MVASAFEAGKTFNMLKIEISFKVGITIPEIRIFLVIKTFIFAQKMLNSSI